MLYTRLYKQLLKKSKIKQRIILSSSLSMFWFNSYWLVESEKLTGNATTQTADSDSHWSIFNPDMWLDVTSIIMKITCAVLKWASIIDTDT